MNRVTILSLIGVVVILLAGSLLLTKNGGNVEDNQDVPTTTADESADLPRTVSGLKQFNASTSEYTLAGTTTVPSPCHMIDATVDVAENLEPDKVTVNLNTVRDESEMCTQVITERRFKFGFEADPQAEIEAGTFDDSPLELNLQSVPEGEDLEDFQVTTKG
jgi:hypothetical protein